MRMQTRPWTMGWDIGGAHVKAALVCEGRLHWAMQWPCPLWQGLSDLERVMDMALEAAHDVTKHGAIQHALTMTGELVDLFSSRSEGVHAIVKCAQSRLSEVQFYAGSKGFVTASETSSQVHAIASANWLATAQALRQTCHAQEGVILVDIGSTTTDIIAITRDGVHAKGSEDFSRLVHDELLYTGCARTPLMALAQRVNFEGQEVNVMAEYFATMADVYRLTAELDEAADQHPAADNGEKCLEASARRMARMIGRDVQSASMHQWQGLAAQYARMQRELMAKSLVRVLARLRSDANLKARFEKPQLVLTGSGAFIAEKMATELGYGHERLSSRMQWQAVENADTCAPAIAVAKLLTQT